MNKKLLLIPIIVVSMALCSCTNKTNTQKEELTEKQEVKTIRYSLWGSEERYQYTVESIEEFEKLYPNINVEIEFYKWEEYNVKFFEQRRENLEADVMEIPYGWMTELADESLYFKRLTDLSDYIDFSYFTRDVLKYGTYRNKQYAVPVSMNSSIQLYNKKLLASKGYRIPDTWDEVKRMVSTFEKDDIYLYGIAKDQVMPMLLNYYEQLNGEASFNSLGVCTLERSDFEEIMKIYQNLVEQRIICPDHENVYQLFAKGKVAAVSCWNSEINEYKKAIEDTDIELALGEYIVGNNSKYFGYFVKPASMYVISSNTKAPIESAIFMNYLLNSKENALIQGIEKGVPISKAAECYLMEANLLNNLEYRAKLLIDFHLTQMSKKPAQLENADYIDFCVSLFGKYINEDIPLQRATKELYIYTYKNLLERNKHEESIDKTY